MIKRNQATSLPIKCPVTQRDGTARDYGVLYGSTETPAAAGTLLNDSSKSALSATIQFKSAVTIGSTDYTAGQVAPSYAGTILSDIDLILDDDQKTPVLNLWEGLKGLPGRYVVYQVTVTETIDGEESAVFWEEIQVIAPPV